MKRGRLVIAAFGILIFLLLIVISIMIKAKFMDTLLKYSQAEGEMTYCEKVF